MGAIHTQVCAAEQCGVLMRNAWRYAHIGGMHIRIHPPTADVSILPTGPVRYVASVEELERNDAPWGNADQEAVEVITNVFGPVLGN
jgi:hypothetical protein